MSAQVITGRLRRPHQAEALAARRDLGEFDWVDAQWLLRAAEAKTRNGRAFARARDQRSLVERYQAGGVGL